MINTFKHINKYNALPTDLSSLWNCLWRPSTIVDIKSDKLNTCNSKYIKSAQFYFKR